MHKNVKSFDQLSLEELYSIQYRIFSIYPLIYHILRNYKYINFSFKNKHTKKAFFDILSLEGVGDKTVFEASNIVISLFYNYMLYDNDEYPIWTINRSKKFFKNAINTTLLKELSKIFFAYDLVTRENIFYRKDFLKKVYFKDNEKGIDLVKKDILFRHDGWWNNYYGKIVDSDALKKFGKLLNDNKNKKKIRKKDFGEYIRFYLTYAYRLVEHDKIKEARKLVKKITRFSWFICYKIGLKNNIPFMIDKGFLKYLLNIFFIDTEFRRYQLNAYMFLYRSTNNKHEKKKYFRKLERLNSLKKFLFFKLVKIIFTRHQLDKVHLIIRPQHMLKMIEYKIDEYQVYKNKIKRKTLLTEINFLFIEIVKSFYLNFYSRNSIFLNYSIITEIFFIIFYYLEKIHGVDIREF